MVISLKPSPPVAYNNGLRKPSGGFPAESRAEFKSETKPANVGEEAEVPPISPGLPWKKILKLSACAETSGNAFASCNQQITLSCLQQIYNSVGVTGSNKDGNQIAVTAYLGQFANLADLKLFYESQNPAAANSSFKVVSVNGGQNSQV